MEMIFLTQSMKSKTIKWCDISEFIIASSKFSLNSIFNIGMTWSAAITPTLVWSLFYPPFTHPSGSSTSPSHPFSIFFPLHLPKTAVNVSQQFQIFFLFSIGTVFSIVKKVINFHCGYFVVQITPIQAFEQPSPSTCKYNRTLKENLLLVH